MRKTYCKTASLMANSCKSVAVLGGHSPTGVCVLTPPSLLLLGC